MSGTMSWSDISVYIIMCGILGAAVKADSSCRPENSKTFQFTPGNSEDGKMLEIIEEFLTQHPTGNGVAIIAEISEMGDSHATPTATPLDFMNSRTVVNSISRVVSTESSHSTKATHSSPVITSTTISAYQTATIGSSKSTPRPTSVGVQPVQSSSTSGSTSGSSSTSSSTSSTTSSTSGSSTSPNTTPVPPSCEVDLRGGCFWTVLHKQRDVTFDEGVNYCADKRSIVAPITNDEDYRTVLKTVRNKMYGSNINEARIWINGTNEPVKIAPANSCNPFRLWLNGYPRNWNILTNLLLHARHDSYESDTAHNGMVDAVPGFVANGVVCFYGGDKTRQPSAPATSNYTVGDCCKTDTKGGCFWTFVRNNTSFAEAKSICKNHSSELAVIPDEEAYNLIISNVRRKISNTGGTVWTGMKINTTTNTTDPQKAFYKWHDQFPKNENGRTNIHTFVSKNKDSSEQGMKNAAPSNETSKWKGGGAICKKKLTKSMNE